MGVATATALGYIWGTWQRRHEERYGLPQLEWERPLPRYLQEGVIRWEPLGRVVIYESCRQLRLFEDRSADESVSAG